MDRRVKERLVGASILVVLIVLIVPELLSGPPAPAPAPEGPRLPASAPEAVRNVTVDLTTSKAPAPEPAAEVAAAGAEPSEAHRAEAASAGAGTDASTSHADANRADTPLAAVPPRTGSAPLESAAPAPTSPSAAKPAMPGRTWAVQLGSFASRANADKLVRQLTAQGFSVYVVSGGSGASLRYRVRIGPMADRGAATQTVAKLKSMGQTVSLVPPAP
jgi:DedD protein